MLQHFFYLPLPPPPHRLPRTQFMYLILGTKVNTQLAAWQFLSRKLSWLDIGTIPESVHPPNVFLFLFLLLLKIPNARLGGWEGSHSALFCVFIGLKKRRGAQRTGALRCQYPLVFTYTGIWIKSSTLSSQHSQRIEICVFSFLWTQLTIFLIFFHLWFWCGNVLP
jgi:hypothetical protein